MKISNSLTRLWSLLTFLFALGFVGWSIALIITTDQKRSDVANRATYISELSKLEAEIQSLDSFFSTNDYSDTLRSNWKKTFYRISDSHNWLKSELKDIKETHKSLAELDTAFSTLNHLFELSVSNSKLSQDNEQVKNLSHQAIRSAALKIKSGNANAGTGESGINDALKSCEWVANQINCNALSQTDGCAFYRFRKKVGPAFYPGNHFLFFSLFYGLPCLC